MAEIRIKNVPEKLKAMVKAEAKRLGVDERAVLLMRIWGDVSAPYGGSLSAPKGDARTPYRGSDKTPKIEAPIDPRHKEVRELIMKLHENKFKVECPWGPAEAGQLGQLLRTIPGVTVEQLGVMVRNRFRSEGISPERPMGWLGNLTKYGAGPLDKFGRTKLELQPEPVQYLKSRYPPEMMEEVRKANED